MGRSPNVASLARIVAVVFACQALAGWGCGDDACPNDDVKLKPTSPRLEALVFAGQVEGDPFELVFTADFRDSDGDLGRGKAHVYLDGGKEPLTIDLVNVFRQSALAPESTRGTMQLPLRFTGITRTSEVRVGMQLEDAARNLSNCYSLELGLRVQSLASSASMSEEPMWSAAGF